MGHIFCLSYDNNAKTQYFVNQSYITKTIFLLNLFIGFSWKIFICQKILVITYYICIRFINIFIKLHQLIIY